MSETVDRVYTYPLVIEEMTDGHSPITYFSKGFHEREPFMETVAIHASHEDDYGEPRPKPSKDAPIRWNWRRCIPMPEDYYEDFAFMYYPAKPYSQGAFPITEVDL